MGVNTQWWPHRGSGVIFTRAQSDQVEVTDWGGTKASTNVLLFEHLWRRMGTLYKSDTSATSP